MAKDSTLRSYVRSHPRLQRLARSIAANVPLSLRLGRDFWQWYAFFDESEHWPVERMREYQTQRLRELLEELARTSDFYRDRLGKVQLDNLDAFPAAVPTLSRQQFRENYERIRAKGMRKRDAVPSSTSGTTGLALQFCHPRRDQAREWAAICHQWKRVGYHPTLSRRAEFRGITGKGRIVDYFPDANMIRCSILDLKEPHLRVYAGTIRDFKADYYHGYPSAIYLLARETMRCGFDFPAPKAFLLASEMVYDWQVDQIQAAFPSARIYAHYGCAERTVLAGWCEYRREYHSLPQYALVERDSATSELIGTNLFNTLNGFVRYRMTDSASEISWEPCPDCRRPYTPRLIKIAGRAEEYLFSPEKGWIPPAIVTYPLKALKAVRELQFFQDQRTEIVIRYSLEPGAEADQELPHELDSIASGMRRLVGNSMRLRFERVDDFERTPTGKFKWIVCNLQESPCDGAPFIEKR